MEIIATITEDYLDAWRKELRRCESLNDVYDLFWEHETQIKSDPAICELFRKREEELPTSYEMIRRGQTMKYKHIQQAWKAAVRNPNT